MAEEVHHHKNDECESTIKAHDHGPEFETKDRGLFDFLGKKEEEKKPQEEVIVTEFEKVHVSEPEPKEEKEKHGLLEKLHRSDSSSSSSSSDEEEVEEAGKKEKKKKKKGLKEKISGDHKEEEKVEKHEEDTSVPVEKCDEVVHAEPTQEPEEKKSFLDKMKEKLPGQKKTEEVPPPPPTPVVECASADSEAKEKKGFLEKIKEKLPGYHPKTEEDKEKEKEKECASH